MANEKRTYEELSAEEKQTLTSRYGIQPKSAGGFSKYAIEYVRELSDDEKMFFQEKSFLTPHFLTQSLYKLKGNLQPIRFNKIIKDTLSENPAFRTNYVQLDGKIVAVVFADRVDLPPVNFRSLVTMDDDEINSALRTIMEADMRDTFDLTRGALVRFSIYKTKADEYAVLVTMAHLIFPEVNMTEIFQKSLGLTVEKTAQSNANLPFKMSEPNVRAYWQRMLDNLPALPSIPYVKGDSLGKQQSKVFRKKISGDLSSEIQHIAKSNRMLLMAFIETAWSLLLSEYNKTSDVFFSALLPDKKGNSKTPAVRAMPVRIKIADDTTVEQLVMSTFQQLLISKPYSSIQVDELQEISGSSRKIFNHFLSFYNFMDEEKEYSEAEGAESGELVSRNSWNSTPSNIGLYFQQENGIIALTMIYNANSFAFQDENRLINRFLRIILQMITDYHTAVSSCLLRFTERLKAEAAPKVERANMALYIRYAIVGVDVFSDVAREDLEIVQKNAEIKTFFEGDRISGEELTDSLVILTKGKAVRNVDTGDGWYRTLDIVKDNSVLNMTMGVLEKPRLPMAIEILTDEAEAIYIKKTSLISLIRKNSLVGKNVLVHALKEMEKYQYLWIQS